jgi:hypothetical protein
VCPRIDTQVFFDSLRNIAKVRTGVAEKTNERIVRAEINDIGLAENNRATTDKNDRTGQDTWRSERSDSKRVEAADDRPAEK